MVGDQLDINLQRKREEKGKKKKKGKRELFSYLPKINKNVSPHKEGLCTWLL